MVRYFVYGVLGLVIGVFFGALCLIYFLAFDVLSAAAVGAAIGTITGLLVAALLNANEPSGKPFVTDAQIDALVVNPVGLNLDLGFLPSSTERRILKWLEKKLRGTIKDGVENSVLEK